MHADLVLYWIRSTALLVTPVAPHFAEQIWSTILQEPTSVQNALWPTPTTPVDTTIIEAGQYMRGTIKTIRDAEVSLLKGLAKAKGKKGAAASEALFDPKKPKAVRIYVATAFPEWQNTCVQIVQESYTKEDNKVDDAKVKELLIEKGLIKDKRAMPFIQAFKVCFQFCVLECLLMRDEQKRMAQYGAETAFRRTLPFSESTVLGELLPYLRKTLGLTDASVLSVEEALGKEEKGYNKSIIDTSEPGSPAFEYYNV